MTDITQFQGAYRWLSNFAPCEIDYEGVSYPSVEAAYMSAKSSDPEWKLFCSDRNNSAGKIKRCSRGIQLISGWNSLKLVVMNDCIRLKFATEPYKTLLLATGRCQLVEGNNWGDRFWGVTPDGIGSNHLGNILMKVRRELSDETLF